jgi:hypothetical protein
MTIDQIFKIFIVVLIILIYLGNIMIYVLTSTPVTNEVDPSKCLNHWYYTKDGTNRIEVNTTCGNPDGDTESWCMTNAYTSGRGKAGINWKFTEDDNDPDCLKNWTLYNRDGTLIEANVKSTTMHNSNRKWCPTNVYLSGQLQNVGWQYCPKS